MLQATLNEVVQMLSWNPWFEKKKNSLIFFRFSELMNWVSLFFFFSVFFFGFGCCFFFSTQVDFFYLSTGSPEAHRRRGGVQPGAGGRRAGHLATGIGPLGNFLSKNKKNDGGRR